MQAESFPAGEHASLIADLRWIRRLAGELALDADRADDLAQDACVVALSRSPSDPRWLRGWLARVMHNLVRQDVRGTERRRAREELVARDERIDATDELVARAGMQRKIVTAVLDLDEPYRSTILLRFFEDLPPREIARLHGVPSTTVQSRVTRGLARLRERLDDGRGDASAWLALVLPLSWKAKGSLASTFGGFIVNTKMTVAVFSIALIATTLAVVECSETTAPLASHAETAHVSESDAAEPPSALDGGLESAGRVGIADAPSANSSTAADAPAAARATHRVRGRVLDAQGQPLAGVELAFTSGDEKTAVRSGGGGAFELETSKAEGEVAASDARFASVCAAMWSARSTIDAVVVVAPAIDVGGAVIDPARAPVEGVRVVLTMPRGFDTSLGTTLEKTRALDWSARTDGAGRFEMRAIPQVSGALLRVLVDGYVPAVLPEPELSDPNLLFQLVRPSALAQGALTGRVLHADGQPAARARVAAGCVSTIADERGEFALDLSRAVTADALTAVKAGFLPARVERPNEPREGDSGWPDYVELRLGSPSLAIGGRVVDEEKKPRANIGVWLADPTPFGLIGTMPVQTESLMAGATIPAHALEPDANPMSSDGSLRRIYTGNGGPPDAVWNYVLTDGDGRFELKGLGERDYKLRFFDERSMHVFTSRTIRAGERDVEIVMPAPDAFEKLSGRVVTVGDRPVSGARILLRAKCFNTQARFFGGTQEVNMLMRGAEVVTDAEGRFSLERVPRERVYLEVRGDTIVSTDWEIPEGVDPANVEVHVDARCRLDVRLAPPIDRADEVSIRDGEDQPILIVHTNSERERTAYFAPLEAGRSGVLSVRSSARRLVLRKNGQIVLTRALDLAPDEINVIEL